MDETVRLHWYVQKWSTNLFYVDVINGATTTKLSSASIVAYIQNTIKKYFSNELYEIHLNAREIARDEQIRYSFCDDVCVWMMFCVYGVLVWIDCEWKESHTFNSWNGTGHDLVENVVRTFQRLLRDDTSFLQQVSFDISTSQFTRWTEMDTDEFTLFCVNIKMFSVVSATSKIFIQNNWIWKYLRNEKSYRYGRSWRYRRLQEPDWFGRLDLPNCPSFPIFRPFWSMHRRWQSKQLLSSCSQSYRHQTRQ